MSTIVQDSRLDIYSFYVGSATKTGKCTVVSGPIEPKGTCVIWAAKA